MAQDLQTTQPMCGGFVAYRTEIGVIFLDIFRKAQFSILEEHTGVTIQLGRLGYLKLMAHLLLEATLS
jgi:hypothetical protein